MPRYFMRDTPLRAMEHLMMSQPGYRPEINFITLQKMWSANTARTMSVRIRVSCVNAPVWGSALRQVF